MILNVEEDCDADADDSQRRSELSVRAERHQISRVGCDYRCTPLLDRLVAADHALGRTPTLPPAGRGRRRDTEELGRVGERKLQNSHLRSSTRPSSRRA